MTQHNNDEDLFSAALIMPTGERAHFLARACADDAATRSRLTGLLDAIDDAADFIRMPALVSQSALDEIRSYRLLRELGEGGCGIAYLAEQLAPVRRQVAVKVIKPGMDTKAVVTRFEAERQLLALMDHPNVAKVFDAGSTVAGRPYFVMELVRGISITEYCNLMRLSIAERMQLFIQVCQAIQHAHHKGVMHRDIKPSNVLVTMHDGVPLVKVIDFGIAKAIQGPLNEQTLHTALEQFVGTPAYIEAERMFRKAIAILERSVSPMHPDRVETNSRLAEVLYLQGRLDEAELLIQDNLKKNLALFGENSSQVAWSLDDLAQIRRRQGRLAEAETYSRRSVAAITASLGEFHGVTGSHMMTLARLLFEQSKYADAEAVVGRALKIFIATQSADHEYIASAEYLLGEIYLATARPVEAEAVLRTSMERWQRSGALPWRAARSASALGEALYRLGRIGEGRKYMIESAAELSGDPKADKPAAHEARARVARYLNTTSPPQNSATRLVSGGPP